MKKEDIQALLIEILRCELTEIPLNEEIKGKLTHDVIVELFKLSKSHDLAHIVANALCKLGLMGTDEVSAAYQKQQMLSVLRCERMTYELSRVCDTLDKAGVPYILLKGSVIRPYYPIDNMRTSSDIDIFIRKEDKEALIGAIDAKLHYERQKDYYNEISYMSDGHTHIEFHYYDITNDEEKFSIISDVWNLCENTQGYRYDLPKEYFLAYHLAHMAKHFSNGGCGIRPFMDLWIMENKMGIARHSDDALLGKYGLERFAEGSYALSDAWFGGKEHTELSAEMQDYIMGAGVYGSSENALVIAKVKKGKTKYLLGKIFLSYPQMKRYYPTVEKYPVLLPIYQIRRWFRIVFEGRTKSAVKQIKDINEIPIDKQAAIDNMLTQLNIK